MARQKANYKIRNFARRCQVYLRACQLDQNSSRIEQKWQKRKLKPLKMILVLRHF